MNTSEPPVSRCGRPRVKLTSVADLLRIAHG